MSLLKQLTLTAIAHQLECFAAIASEEEDPQLALKLFGAAEALSDQVKSPMTNHEHLEDGTVRTGGKWSPHACQTHSPASFVDHKRSGKDG